MTDSKWPVWIQVHFVIKVMELGIALLATLFISTANLIVSGALGLSITCQDFCPQNVQVCTYLVRFSPTPCAVGSVSLRGSRRAVENRGSQHRAMRSRETGLGVGDGAGRPMKEIE